MNRRLSMQRAALGAVEIVMETSAGPIPITDSANPTRKPASMTLGGKVVPAALA